jgi:MIP family channel proteins
MIQDKSRAYLAETIGTFAVVFVSAGAVCLNEFTGRGMGLLGVALASGLMLSVAVTATAHLSGGHLNPAVTFGFFILGKMDRSQALRYVGFQLLGATRAGFSLRAIFDEHVWRQAQLGTPVLAPEITTARAIFLEAILAFLLVFAFWATLQEDRAPRIGGFGVGLTWCAEILVAGPLTGAAANPARAFGPALASGQWGSHLVYWIGPLLGGGLAAFLYAHFLAKQR